jgi:hypothetical protein
MSTQDLIMITQNTPVRYCLPGLSLCTATWLCDMLLANPSTCMSHVQIDTGCGHAYDPSQVPQDPAHTQELPLPHCAWHEVHMAALPCLAHKRRLPCDGPNCPTVHLDNAAAVASAAPPKGNLLCWDRCTSHMHTILPAMAAHPPMLRMAMHSQSIMPQTPRLGATGQECSPMAESDFMCILLLPRLTFYQTLNGRRVLRWGGDVMPQAATTCG